jgi:methylglutaconyl-CoA hydratase
VVLAGNGPAFCAGMDLDEMQQRAAAADPLGEWEQDARGYRDLLGAILRLDVPTLAVVQGPAVAGGFGIVLACDLVLASSSASFAMPEVRRGISPAVVSPLLLLRIGAAAASPILYCGQALTAEAAHRLNLCQYVAEPGGLDEERRRIVESILAAAPQAVAMTKRLVRSFYETALQEQLDAGMAVSAAARRTDEAREGLAAFLEKRAPHWTSRLL